MNGFVFVLDLKTGNLIKTNLTSAENPAYCNIFNPGLLEQKPGQEQGLTVLLYESLYAA